MHTRAAVVTYVLLCMKQIDQIIELAADPAQWDALDVIPIVRVVRDRRSGEILLLEPPVLDAAAKVVGLDAVAVIQL